MTVAVEQIPDVPNDMEFNHWNFMQKLKDAIKDVNAGLYVAPVGSKVCAYLGTDQTGVVTTTWTKVELDTTEFDVLSEFDTDTNNRFIAAKAGYYQVTGQLRIETIADGDYYGLAIYKNGTRVSTIHIEVGGGATTRLHTSKLLYLDVEDYVELWGRHNYAGNRDFDAGLSETFLTIHRIF